MTVKNHRRFLIDARDLLHAVWGGHIPSLTPMEWECCLQALASAAFEDSFEEMNVPFKVELNSYTKTGDHISTGNPKGEKACTWQLSISWDAKKTPQSEEMTTSMPVSRYPLVPRIGFHRSFFAGFQVKQARKDAVRVMGMIKGQTKEEAAFLIFQALTVLRGDLVV